MSLPSAVPSVAYVPHVDAETTSGTRDSSKRIRVSAKIWWTNIAVQNNHGFEMDSKDQFGKDISAVLTFLVGCVLLVRKQALRHNPL
jgi:hypothetical protein